MNHEDRQAIGFFVLGGIVIILAAIGLLSCQPIAAVKAPAAASHQPRSALI
jgi:hypothetical protein